MTENQRIILGNTLNEACLKMDLKAAILICFEEGSRTIIPIGRNLELCCAAESLAAKLHEGWASDPTQWQGDLPPIPDILN